MGLKIGKYAFKSNEQALSKIKGLGIEVDEYGNEIPTHLHAVVELGLEELSPNIYEEETGELLQPAIYGTDYLVDVLWTDIENEDGSANHPYGWATYSANVSNEGVHSFSGLKYQELKITNN